MEWQKGYWTGVLVLSGSLVLIFRPDLIAKYLRSAADWLDEKPVYRMYPVPGKAAKLPDEPKLSKRDY